MNIRAKVARSVFGIGIVISVGGLVKDNLFLALVGVIDLVLGAWGNWGENET